jgi:two-component system heavy metal sensor histidine kinase CusS
MRSKSAERSLMPRSITTRLTLLYSGSVFLILMLSIAAVYVTLDSSFDREDDDFLSSRVAEVGAVLDKESLSSPTIESEVALGSAASRYARNYIRVLDGQGLVIAETPGMAKLLPASVFSARRPGETAEITGPADARPYMILRAPAPSGREIEAALDISEEDQLNLRTGLLLLGILTAGMLLAVASGWLVTRRGLAPLTQITRTAQRITAANLDQRLGEATWPTELATLAAVFDDMLARLRGSFRRLSDFSANLAHELRTPINNLMGEAEVALGQERTPEEYRRLLVSATEEYARLARLVDNLLFLARTDAAEAPAGREPVEARAVLEQVRDYYAALAEDRDVALTCDGSGRVPADPLLLQRAVGNLVSNALRHTPAGGRVAIIIEEAGEGTQIAVADTGSGIAADELPRVFERFYRAAGSRADHPEGTGLGLAIVRSIMELHGGGAGIESEPGRGTTVRLRFPKITMP